MRTGASSLKIRLRLLMDMVYLVIQSKPTASQEQWSTIPLAEIAYLEAVAVLIEHGTCATRVFWVTDAVIHSETIST